jgi:hypothetical protein
MIKKMKEIADKYNYKLVSVSVIDKKCLNLPKELLKAFPKLDELILKTSAKAINK